MKSTISRLIVISFSLLVIIVSCSKDEQATNKMDAIKNELTSRITFLKQSKTNIPSDFQTIDDCYKKEVKSFFFFFYELKNKSKDENVFYNNYFQLLSKYNFQQKSKSSEVIDTTIISTIGDFIITTYFYELKSNNYNFTETGLILEDVIMSNSILEGNSKLILANFVASSAYTFDELAKSGVLTTNAKMTWAAFHGCLSSETDAIFSNPVKSVQFILGCPASWFWLQADCVYQTWNA